VKGIEEGITEDAALNRAARRVVVLGEARAERVLFHQLRCEGREKEESEEKPGDEPNALSPVGSEASGHLGYDVAFPKRRLGGF
jgi:hypothetical protein